MSELPASTGDRRSHPRSPINLPIRIANYREDLSLDQMLFLVRECRNLSVGGVSYFTAEPPTSAQIVVEVPGAALPRYMLAHIRNVRRVADARYFTCCQFIRQLN